MPDEPIAPGPEMVPPGPPPAGPPPSTSAPPGYGYAAPQPAAAPYGVPPGPAYPQGPAYPAYPVQVAQGPSGDEAALRKARVALGWAIGAAVAAGLAAVGALIALLVAMGNSVEGPLVNGYSVRGQVGSFQPGEALSGDRLAATVIEALETDGSDVGSLLCPDTGSAGPSSVVVCTGDFDGRDDWTLVVYVIDAEGHILVTEY